MNCNKTIFFLTIALLSINSLLLSMDQAVNDVRILRGMIDSSEQLLRGALQPSDGTSNSRASVMWHQEVAKGILTELQTRMQPELNRRTQVHEGHTVAPLINAVFGHAVAPLQRANNILATSAPRNVELDGIVNNDIVSALHAHTESKAILERLFGIVNNQQAAFEPSRKELKHVFARASWSKKIAIANMLKDHYHQWFGQTVVANANTTRSLCNSSAQAGSTVACTSTASQSTASQENSEEEGACCSNSSGCAPDYSAHTENTGLCKNQLATAERCRAYLHDMCMKILIALEDVDLLLDDLACRLPLDEDGISSPKTLQCAAGVDSALSKVSLYGNKLVQICHDGYTTTLPGTVCPIIVGIRLQLQKNRRVPLDIAQCLKPEFADKLDNVLQIASKASSVGKNCEKVGSATYGFTAKTLGFLATAASCVAPEHLSQEEINACTEEQLEEVEKNKTALVVAAVPQKQGDAEKDDKDKKDNCADVSQLFNCMRSQLENLAPLIKKCAPHVRELHNYLIDSNDNDRVTVQAILQFVERTVASLVELNERLRYITFHRYTRDESFGLPAFRELMVAMGRSWQPVFYDANEDDAETDEHVASSETAADGIAQPASVGQQTAAVAAAASVRPLPAAVESETAQTGATPASWRHEKKDKGKERVEENE